MPIVGVFQLRPWRLGCATKIVLAVRGGRTRRFAASVLKDRAAVVRALDQRAASAATRTT